ncbi:MAG: type II toxin-antitoxin system Phd/YefM family antitoxin [Lachnospiraceae bacterium]|nr:type II toxin-antitoxin system Phd/YefM family antitoxin [Lachnospiraceae bacterium]
MTTASIFEAKTNLSKYISAIVSKEVPYVLIVRNGKPVAKLVPLEEETGGRIGVGAGIIPQLKSPEEFNSIDVTEDFEGIGGLL